MTKGRKPNNPRGIPEKHKKQHIPRTDPEAQEKRAAQRRERLPEGGGNGTEGERGKKLGRESLREIKGVVNI